MGFKFDTIVAPPFASATTCPQLKDNCVISVDWQHIHLDLPISSPILVFHTSFLIVAEMAFFFAFLQGITDVSAVGSFITPSHLSIAWLLLPLLPIKADDLIVQRCNYFVSG